MPIDLWNTMWPAPTSQQLPYNLDTMALSGPQALGAFFVSLWVYLAIGLLGAFAISFYFSANTILYLLMRREVDATELDDVYLEQSEEEFGDAPPAAVVAPGDGAAVADTPSATGTTVVTAAPATGGAQVYTAPPTTPPTT